MKINESQIRKIVRKALLEASQPAGIGTPDQTTSRKQQADNKVDDTRNAEGITALANLATSLLKNKEHSAGDGNLKTFLGILNGAQKKNLKDFESFMRNKTIKNAYDKYNKDSAVPKKKSSGQASSKKKAPQKRKSSSFKFPVSDKVKAIQKTVGAPSSKTKKGADGKWGKNTSAAFAAWLKTQDFSKLKKARPAKTEEPKVNPGIANTPVGGTGSKVARTNENISRRQLRLMINEVLRTGRIIKEAATEAQSAMIDTNKNNPVAIAKQLGYAADLDGIEELVKDLSAGKDVGSSDDLGSSLSFEYEDVDYTQNTDSDGNVTYSEANSNETINDPAFVKELEDAAAASQKKNPFEGKDTAEKDDKKFNLFRITKEQYQVPKNTPSITISAKQTFDINKMDKIINADISLPSGGGKDKNSHILDRGNEAFYKPYWHGSGAHKGSIRLDGPQFYNYKFTGYVQLANGDLVPSTHPDAKAK